MVTATRREQRLQSVPPGISTVTGEELQRRGATQFADYARGVPGLSFTNGGTGGEKQTIRGVSVNPWSEVNSGTAVHLNEVPMTSPGGTTGPPFNPDPVLIDINRIEILRGPQGTLFGAGSMGGAIRIITNPPNLQTFSAKVGATLTHTQDGEPGYGLHGMVNAHSDDNRTAIRAVAYQRDLGGFIDNVLDGRDDVNNHALKGGRFAASRSISDSVKVTANIIHQSRESDGFNNEEPSVGQRQQRRISESVEDVWTNYNIVFDVDMGWGDLISSTSFLDREVDTVADVSFFLRLFFGLDNPLNVVNNEGIGEFVQEFRLVSDTDSRLNWLAGIYYQNQEQDIGQDFPSPGFDSLTGGLASMFGPPDNLFVRRENYSLEQIALYGEVSYQLTSQISLSAGGRWYDIDRDYRADNSGLLFVMGQVQESFSAGDDGVIPNISLSYAANDRWSLYGSVSAGFRPGGINPPGAIMEPSCAMELAALGFNSTPTSYQSDSLVNAEAGFRFTNANTRINGAIYRIDWSDIQTMNFLNCGTGFFQNAGEAESTGVEFELVSKPLENLEYTVAVSYTRAELRNDVPNLRGVDGDRLPGVPQFTASSSLRYEFPSMRGRIPSIGVDLQHVGESYIDFNRAADGRLPAHTVANLRFGIQSERWSATIFARNLFDEDGIVFIVNNLPVRSVTPIRPRTVGLSISRQF